MILDVLQNVGSSYRAAIHGFKLWFMYVTNLGGFERIFCGIQGEATRKICNRWGKSVKN